MITGDNLSLITSRMTKGEIFAHAQVSRNICEVICMSAKTSNNGFIFPLLVREEALELNFRETKTDIPSRRPNFSHAFINNFGNALNLPLSQPHGLPIGLSPEDILHYIYTVFHSPSYRSRYAEFLKIDFPRLPLTGSIELFRALASLGNELVSLHLLESPKLANTITRFSGANRTVGKVGWTPDNGGTVWIDGKGTSKAFQAGASGFHPVPEAVWNFHIGGYQVCEKWLKDRKGRALTDDDLAHYHKIVIALTETIRLMSEIDATITTHGGWPGAFQTAFDKQ
jgi:hypothetical protein